MRYNDVWNLVELPKGCKRIGFKTKCDSHDNLECYNTRLVAKKFTQKDGVDHKETFSPFSQTFFEIIKTLVTHYNLELHQMNVKNVFLEGYLEENFIWPNHWDSQLKERNAWCVSQRNKYMDVRKLGI